MGPREPGVPRVPPWALRWLLPYLQEAPMEDFRRTSQGQAGADGCPRGEAPKWPVTTRSLRKEDTS